MIIKKFEIKKELSNFPKYNFFLLYGENFGLKKDVKNAIKKVVEKKNGNADSLTLHENEIVNNDENFFNFFYSGSLFGNQKIITIFDATDKIIDKIENVYSKNIKDIFLIIFSGILEKKSKLRNFFESNKDTVCVPCYLDEQRDLEIIANMELKKNNITLSKEALNFLIEKSNSDRDNLKNELKKIIAYSLNKKNLDFEDIKSLANFTGDYKSDVLVNECLCGNLFQYKKMLSEFYINTGNQILLLRILGNKVQRLLKIKEKEDKLKNLENLIDTIKPVIFWKEKPLIKKQLTIWSLNDLNKIIEETNNTELLCKKNPQISKFIFMNFFSNICIKASNFA